MAADSRASTSYAFHDQADKIVRVQGYLVGVSGSVRVGQLVRFHADKFGPAADSAGVFAFATTLKKILAADYELRTGNDNPEKWTALLATPSGVYCVHRNFQFDRHERWAVGFGDDYGLGMYDGLGEFGDTEARIRKAIEATARYTPTVGGPVKIFKVSDPDTQRDKPSPAAWRGSGRASCQHRPPCPRGRCWPISAAWRRRLPGWLGR